MRYDEIGETTWSRFCVEFFEDRMHQMIQKKLCKTDTEHFNAMTVLRMRLSIALIHDMHPFRSCPLSFHLAVPLSVWRPGVRWLFVAATYHWHAVSLDTPGTDRQTDINWHRARAENREERHKE